MVCIKIILWISHDFHNKFSQNKHIFHVGPWVTCEKPAENFPQMCTKFRKFSGEPGIFSRFPHCLHHILDACRSFSRSWLSIPASSASASLLFCLPSA